MVSDLCDDKARMQIDAVRPQSTGMLEDDDGLGLRHLQGVHLGLLKDVACEDRPVRRHLVTSGTVQLIPGISLR
jgi:hypothetical protein